MASVSEDARAKPPTGDGAKKVSARRPFQVEPGLVAYSQRQPVPSPACPATLQRWNFLVAHLQLPGKLPGTYFAA